MDEPEQTLLRAYQKLEEAAGIALEVLEKHRQMKGDAPMGMRGHIAIEELSQAFAEVRRAALEQPQQEPVACSKEQADLLNFLLGASDFDGVWFGEKHPHHKGQFWWRSLLGRLFAAPQPQPQQEPVAIHQFRRRGCSDWYDGVPNRGEVPHVYEVRTLYTAPQPARDDWQEEARRYAQNADFWKSKHEADTAELRRLYEEVTRLKADIKTYVRVTSEMAHETADDTALLRQALVAMRRGHFAVADNCPHRDVMDYNAVMDAIEERLK